MNKNTILFVGVFILIILGLGIYTFSGNPAQQQDTITEVETVSEGDNTTVATDTSEDVQATNPQPEDVVDGFITYFISSVPGDGEGEFETDTSGDTSRSETDTSGDTEQDGTQTDPQMPQNPDKPQTDDPTVLAAAHMSDGAKAQIENPDGSYDLARFIGVQDVPDQGYTIQEVTFSENPANGDPQGLAAVNVALQYTGNTSNKTFILTRDGDTWLIDAVDE